MIPTSTNVKLDCKSAIGNSDAVLAFVTQSKEKADYPLLARAEQAALRRLIDDGAVTGKASEVAFAIAETARGKFRRVYAIGLGKPQKVTTESFRQAGGAAFRSLRSHRIDSAGFVLPDSVKAVSTTEAAEALVVGALLASFDYAEYKGTGRNKEDAQSPKRLQLSIVSVEKSVRDAVARGQLIADGQNFARTIASRPGNDITPPTLAKAAQSMAREVKLKCRVLDEKELARLKMGGILAVGAAASRRRRESSCSNMTAHGRSRKRAPAPCWLSARQSHSIPAASRSNRPIAWAG